MSELLQKGTISKVIHEGNKTDYSIVYKTITGKSDERIETTIRADSIQEFEEKLKAVKDLTS